MLWGCRLQFVVSRGCPDPVLSCRYFALGLLYHYNHQDAAAVQVSSEASRCCCKTTFNSESLEKKKSQLGRDRSCLIIALFPEQE